MTVGFSTQTFVNNNNNTQGKKVHFGVKEKISQKKQEFSSAMKDEQKRYNIIGVVTGLLILGGLGYGILNNAKVFNIFEKKKSALKKYLKPTSTTYELHRKPHGGPEVDITKGPTAIHDAWTSYINRIKNNRKNNANVFKYYKEIFEQNAAKLDELEAKAKDAVIKRGGIWENI